MPNQPSSPLILITSHCLESMSELAECLCSECACEWMHALKVFSVSCWVFFLICIFLLAVLGLSCGMKYLSALAGDVGSVLSKPGFKNLRPPSTLM